jgi:peptidoglycan/LPS O-acetylase OafA/YrhL
LLRSLRRRFAENDMYVYEVRPRRAPPLGRALRILIGLALIAYVTPVFFRVPLRFTGKVFLLVLGLIGLFSLLHVAVSRRIVAFRPSLGAVVAAGLLVALYVVGTHGSLIFGHGEGALAVITFLGISLVIAGVRAALGCEVMAIPSLLLRKHTELACLIFSPLDNLEWKLRSKRQA